MLIAKGVSDVAKRVTVAMPSNLIERIQLYQRAVTETVGHDVSRDEVISLLIEYAMNADRDFVKYEKQSRQVITATPAQPCADESAFRPQ